ncbi:lipopolysaccharide biosynthesis protein [uncultured Enterovirga sp.]|uniref:lipopolysaccharide biosynthesis protein n=1 Tax=uncultured Enterovirga sp. TaxID=2026352 RepID=UPI0035CC6ADF
MIRRHLALYFLSRGFAAVGNLVAVAVFTRLAGPEVYGHYVVMFAAALVISGFSVQWIRYAFFNHYRSDEDRDFFASFLALIAASMLVTVAVAAIAFALDGASFAFAAGALLIGLGTALFEVITEVCRTRLEVGRASLALVLKASLVLALGTLALLFEQSALALAAGIAVAHLVASIPAAITLGRLIGGRPTWREARKLLVFGWPLMLSFGIGAFAQGIDRFYLASLEGAAVIGAYGALSDIVRASFTVLAESVSLATVPLAKRQFSAGERGEALRTLNHAFRLLLVVGTFMTAAFLVFAPVLLPVIFPPSFLEGSETLLPPILVASFLLVVRNVYLAQIIYFTRASQLELVSALILAVVNLVLCAVLIPRHGALGAALAFLGGQVAAGLFFLLAGRGEFRMPTPWRPVVGMALLGIALTLAGQAVSGWQFPLPTILAAQAGLFVLALAITGLGFGLRPRTLLAEGSAVLAAVRR